MSGSVRVGLATVDCSPPIGVDLAGFLRRDKATTAQQRTLEVSVLAADDGTRRVAVVALDLAYVFGQAALDLRQRVANVIGAAATNVLLNCSHTHTAPSPPGHPKMGGHARRLTPREQQYWRDLGDATEQAAQLAVDQLTPSRLTVGSSAVPNVASNRRETVGNGEVIIGLDPSAPCDRSVNVLRFDSDRGQATVVNYACHPTVLGPEIPEATPDFVGPLRDAVRGWTDGACMFLQGCAGDVAPISNIWDVSGDEERVGRAVALEALRASESARLASQHLTRNEYYSGTKAACYRWVDDGGGAETRVDASERIVDLPLERLPTLQEIRSVARQLERRAQMARASELKRHELNSLVIHSEWARRTERRIADGSARRALRARVQVVRINDVAIVGLPGEPFNEIGTEIKRLSPVATVTCGYSNEALGYVPTSAEYDRGGYEVVTSHRNYDYEAPLARGADVLIQDAATGLLKSLF